MATKKEETKLNIPLDNVRIKLQAARVKLQEMNLKKSGKNDFAHFQYYQLEDFLPQVNKIFATLGLYSEFCITPQVIDYEEVKNGEETTKKPIIKELAILQIMDTQKTDDILTYEMEVAPVMIGNNSKQNMYQAAGGRNSYYKRYLYMNALEITESDEIDAVSGQEGVNYQQPQMTPYDFMPQQAQPIQTAQMPNNNVAPQPMPVQMDNNTLNTIAENIENATEEVKSSMEPLSTESKMEIMQMVNDKGLNGAEIISEFCKQNSLNGTNDLLEAHKSGLIELINNYGN
jgi:hypothetical protein